MNLEKAQLDDTLARRESALKLKRPCARCKSGQVQLTNWLDDPAEFKCRACGHEWSTVVIKDAHA